MEPRDLTGLHTYIDSMYSTSRASPLHVFLALPQIDIKELEKVAEAHRLRASVRATNSSPKMRHITLGVRKRTVRGWLVSSDVYWVFLIQPSESSTAAGAIARTWLSSMFPALAFARIDSENLIDLLNDLNKSDAKLLIHSYTLKRQGERAYKYTTKSWEGKGEFDQKKILDYAASSRRLVDAAHITLEKNGKSLFEAVISRSGHLIYYRGDESGFSNFLRLIATRVSQYAIKKLDSFKGMEARLIRNEFAVMPITYVLEKNGETFDEGVVNLQKALSQDAGFSLSIEHAGNPWFSMHVMDRGDGSIYDLHLFSHQLRIIPLTKATPHSLSYLTSLIEEVFPSSKRIEEVTT